MTHLPPSSVAFPSSSQDRSSVYSTASANPSDYNSIPPPPLPYLPFRRISLPSLPPQALVPHQSPLRRPRPQQRASVSSFESLPESDERDRRESGSSAMGRIVVPKNRITTASTSTTDSPHVTPRKGPRRTAISMQIGSRPSISPMRKGSTPAVPPLDDQLLMKRRKVMKEFYETEKAYVDGLDLIYNHFLLPILNSLETPTPILDRPLLTAVFSNFIDVWNLHRSFFNELTRLFYPPSTPAGFQQRETNTPPPSAATSEPPKSLTHEFPLNPPPISSALLAHFPYLSLYTPFITAFPDTLAALNTLLTPSSYYRQPPRAQTRAAAARAQSSNPPSSASPSKSVEVKYDKRFAEFVATQEKDPRCGKFKLRDWLLTIVQRCPRYLLLLNDLLSCTPGESEVPLAEGKEGTEQLKEKMRKDRNKWYREATKEEEKERERLIQVLGLVAKITSSLNTSLYSHSQTLSLLSLQRATPNLPDEFQFISPGRSLLKRGTLLQIENPDARVERGESKDGDMRPREREFLLFSDCLVWLASEEAEKREKEWNFDLGAIWSSFSGGHGSGSSTPTQDPNSGSERPKSAALAHSTPLIVEEDALTTDDGTDSGSGTDGKDGRAPASAVPHALRRPPMVRTRSKSEAEVTILQAKAAAATTANEAVASSNIPSSSKSALPAPAESHLPRRPTLKSQFSRINRKNSALHLHFRDRRGRRNSPSSPKSAARVSWGEKEQWIYKGRIQLVNLEIVVDGLEEETSDVSGTEGQEGLDVDWRWEVLSPEGSFVLYAPSAQDRAEWTLLIRQAKAQQLVSLNAQHPNSTLTSSAATQHIRRTLQALPFAPNDVRMREDKMERRLSRISADSGHGESVEDHYHDGKGKGKERESNRKKHKKTSSKEKNSKIPKPAWYKERRSRVEHWVPAIWIPDEKAEGCMRCGRPFGWRRRRHHCRLCGRCVCSSCSEMTFYISDPNAKDEAAFSKPARACNACYESVFPLIDPPSDHEEASAADESTVRARSKPPALPHSSVSDPTNSPVLPPSASALSYASTADTITSLSNLPSWMNMSVPALALSSSSNTTGVGARNQSKGKQLSGPEALMAIDSKRYSYGADERRRSSGKERFSRDSGVVFDLDSSADESLTEDMLQSGRIREAGSDDWDGGGSRVKLRSPSSTATRPRSYHQILEDFSSSGAGEVDQLQSRLRHASPLEETDEEVDAGFTYGDTEDSSALSSSSVTSSKRHTTINLSTSSSSVSLSTSPPNSSGPFLRKGKGPLSGVHISDRKEDTVRRNKRFSMPAVALQTTSVVARTQSILPDSAGGGGGRPVREQNVAFAEHLSPFRREESRLGGGGSLLPGMPGTRSKRFSLVLGSRHLHGHSSHATGGHHNDSTTPAPSSRLKYSQEGSELGKGVAASKLNELLGRKK